MPHAAGQFDIKLAFLQELEKGYQEARSARDRLLITPEDTQALSELRHFFHRIAGTARMIDMAVLGSLGAVCERVALFMADGTLKVTNGAIQMITDALNGVADVLEAHGAQPGTPPPVPGRPRVPASSDRGLQAPDGILSKILVIDDDPFSAGLIDTCLREAGFLSSFCCDPLQAMRQILTELPDLVILDVLMPDINGFDLCRQLRLHPALQLTPVIFVTRQGDIAERVQGLEAGGNDYIAKPFEPLELVARVRSHLQRLAMLQDMVIRDGLTRAYNHKYFKARLFQEMERSQRYKASLSLGLLDIDHFKQINDTYGHSAGDMVLAHLSNIVLASVRTTDIVARYGGEEFALLLVQCTVAEAGLIAGRIRERIEKYRFAIEANEGGPPINIPVTVSIGVTHLQPGEVGEGFFRRADSAMYEAKSLGRNRVTVKD